MNGIRAPADGEIKEKIKKEYEKGAKPKELSNKYGISINTLKSWIKREEWGKAGASRGAPSEKKDAPRRGRGAPEGNQNAEGHGAPEKNCNAVKHGGYSSVYWDFLKDDEVELEVPDDEEDLLLEQIRLFSIRERRLMKAINKYSAKELYMTGITKSETKRKFKDAGEEAAYNEAIKKKVKKNERLPGESIEVTTNTGASIELVSRLERELTAIQGKKTKAIDSLARLRLENQKMNDAGKGSDVVDAWISAVMGEEPLDEEGGDS